MIHRNTASQSITRVSGTRWLTFGIGGALLFAAFGQACAPSTNMDGADAAESDAGVSTRDAAPGTRDAGASASDASSMPVPTDDSGSQMPPTPGSDSGTSEGTDSGGPSEPTPPTPPPTGGTGTHLGACAVFPADNAWKRDVSSDPLDPDAAAIIANIQGHANGAEERNIKADFGSDPAWGLPYVVVPASQSMTPVTFNEYGDESDPGPYPVPRDAPIEGGNDHHVLVVHEGTCRLYEMYHARWNGSGWTAGSGAMFDLTSNALRPSGWTSCDQAGLPILPGLVRYDEIQAGEIRHALRVTINEPGATWVDPARHPGTSGDQFAPPMGARLRLRADFDLSPYHGAALIVMRALKRYGMFIADTGTNWYISGATDPRWNDDDLGQLRNVPGTAFEVVRLGTRQHW